MTTAVAFLVLRLTLAALLLGMLGVILVELRRGLRPPPAVGSGLPMACLVPELDAESEPSFALAGMNSVGRAPGNSITLDHPSVSSYHARLSFVSGTWLLEDLGSRNGTRVNGLEVREPLAVTYGDRIRFGAVGYQLTAGGLAPQLVAAPQALAADTAPANGAPADSARLAEANRGGASEG